MTLELDDVRVVTDLLLAVDISGRTNVPDSRLAIRWDDAWGAAGLSTRIKKCQKHGLPYQNNILEQLQSDQDLHIPRFIF